MVNIEIDGKTFTVDNGKMIIEVADEAGIQIPRFCYHKKLSVAANCRMCLVEVEKSRKPLPACATPVTEGMKILTQSEMAKQAQKIVMEFLLINHPLDCPICDQGGECELQDVSMGYGSDISKYTEEKRVVDDENIGSLISTEMTRCIHCTRCVRFGEEVAGIRELGATGRGEAMKIGTFIKHSLTSEVSGNIIDLCPVGALTSKPYRYTARPWELKEYPGIAPHDCLGSNIKLHARRQQIMRVVPRENEAINETWISDRDRFSYQAIHSIDRVGQPMIKSHGQWQVTDWETALKCAVSGLTQIKKTHGGDAIGALASPSATLEELFLLQKLMRGIGSHNIDHRLQQSNFADQSYQPMYPTTSTPYETLESSDAILLIGSNIHREQPLAGLRIRKAALQAGVVMAINPIDFDYLFPVKEKIISVNHQMVLKLAEIAKELSEDSTDLSKEITQLLGTVKEVSESAKTIAAALKKGEQSRIVLGALAENHPHAASIRTLANLIAKLSQAEVMQFTVGSNAAGAWLAGAIPHRGVAGNPIVEQGLTARQMIEQPLASYILLNTEPETDCVHSAQALAAMETAELVVAITPYTNDNLLAYADVILPMASFAETSGTYVNIDGDWQSFTGAITPFEQARPAWKILRVLGNLFNLNDFDYLSSQEIHDDIQHLVKHSDFKSEGEYIPESLTSARHGLLRIGEWSMYCIDAIVRRASALHQSASHDLAKAKINTQMAQRLFLTNVSQVEVIQDDNRVICALEIDDRIADNTVYLASGHPETQGLGDAYGVIDIKAATKVNEHVG